MSKPKVIVTGGAGFIGSHTVVELAQAGFDPVIVDDFSNSEERALRGIANILGFDVKCHRVDCNDAEALTRVFDEEQDVTGVVHFAAYKAVGGSVKEPILYHRNNIGSTLTLMDVMDKAGVKQLVFSSSCTVYGQPEVLPVTEQSPSQEPTSPYARTKQICEGIISDVARSGVGLKAISLRYFNPIGAHSSAEIGELPLGVPNNLIPYLTQVAAGLREKLTVFGNDYPTKDGSAVRDYIHVVDLAKAHVKALQWLQDRAEDGTNTFFNVGTGQGQSVLEIIRAFESGTGLKLNWDIGPRREGDIEQIWADPSYAEQELKWKAELSIEQAVTDAWRWQQKLLA